MRKRQRSGPHSSASLSKRSRGAQPAAAGDSPDDGSGSAAAAGRSSSPSMVMVTGLPVDCTVLELKGRLEMYGPISRTRIEVDGTGYITFRSDAAAEAAIVAALDPARGVTIRSRRVLVIRASEPPPQCNTHAGAFTHSKLLRAETPLRKHGKRNKILSDGTTNIRSGSDPYKGREVVAYDDLF